MEYRQLRVLLVAAVVLGPTGLVVGYGLASVAWSKTVWESSIEEDPGEVQLGELRPGVLYRLVVTADCFSGADYGLQVALWSDDYSTLVVNEEREFFFERGACRSTFETQEFSVTTATNYTVGWNLSDEALDHGPRLRLVEVMMPLDEALHLVFFGLFGGINVFSGTLIATSLFGRRPPGRMPTGFHVPIAAATGA